MEDIQSEMHGLSIAEPSSTDTSEGTATNQGETMSYYNDNNNNWTNKNKKVWYNALRDDALFQSLVGKWDDGDDDYDDDEEVISIPYYSVHPPPKTNTTTEEEKDNSTMIELTPFRKLASKLPFALRFKLEMHLFDGESIEIQQIRPPRNDGGGTMEEWDIRKEEIAMAARRLVVAFIEDVVPPLLEIDWVANDNGGGSMGLDVDNFTLSELFAEAIGPKLCAIKQRLHSSEQFSFGRTDIDSAIKRAEELHKEAVRICGGSERDLGAGDCTCTTNTDIELLKRRALWPYAEYSCKFLDNGKLIPSEYEVVNNCHHRAESSSYGSSRRFGLKSRRGLREAGWLARDRFARVTNSFDVSVNEDLGGWIRDGPTLCGRDYVFLFDKGVGGNMKVWLFSEHVRGMSSRKPDLQITRNQFLSSLGILKDVPIGKVGDRISLAFSQTSPIIRFSEDQIIPIPDIVRNGYAFSDGNGVMGIDVARAIKEEMGLEEIPGAAQIRIGGVKGMLSLDVNFKADSIGIRPSQVKFRSSHRVLEVKCVAKSVVGVSNKLFKEALLVMDHLGVKCSAFYNLQERACVEMILENDVKAREIFAKPKKDESDQPDYRDYLRNVLEYGTKMNGEKFILSELEEIEASMIAAKDKVNLNLLCSVMFGIIDEYDVLEENEVLVCNGRITGEILILRSPCMFPGDIQKVTAVHGKTDKAFTYLDQVIVFSAKGDRPLPDMLGGGDLDGDEYFIVYEPVLAGSLSPSEPNDFGTKNPNTCLEANTIQNLCAPAEHISLVVPDINDQLRVLHDFIMNGNLVSQTADAWLRMADVYGVADENVQKLAKLHQRALDSRKSYDNFDRSQLKYMHDVLSTMPVPHYRRGTRKGKKHSSFLGVLYEFKRHNIKAINIFIERLRIEPFRPPSPLDVEIVQNKQLKISAMNYMKELDLKQEKKYKYCVTCGDMKKCNVMKKCAVCGVAWVCVGTPWCEVSHWRICFGIHWRQRSIDMDDFDEDSSISSSTIVSFVNSRESSRDITADTISLTSFDESEISLSMETRDVVGYLIDIVFGVSEKPSLAGKQIDWRYLDADQDLPTLRELVLVEFYAGFKKELRDARKKIKDKVDTPHILDVFLMEPRLERGNTTLAVCVRNEMAGGLLMWRDGHGNEYPINPPFHLFRVASLSGTCRILDSLHTNPSPNTLMNYALRRNSDVLAEVNEDRDGLNLEISKLSGRLNASQIQAVATLHSQSFKEGFFLVHGPPGTGKTLTLAAMVASIGGGIIVAPSNAAVANVAIKVLTLEQFNIGNVVVFGENCEESVRFLSPIHRSRHFITFRDRYLKVQGNKDPKELLSDFADWLRLDKAELLGSKRPVRDIMLAAFAFWLRLPPDRVSMHDIEAHCPRVDESFKGQTVLHRIISAAKVVLCTLNTAGSTFLRRALARKFDTIFLDEAAQCPEAEFYIATTFPGIERIVLIGDPRQLNATVLDVDCDHMGYGDSWMEHVMDALALGSTKVHMLNIQYRCDPRILEFSNKHFYRGNIKTDKSVSGRKPIIKFPIQFVDTYRHGEEEYEGLSLKNDFEADCVCLLLKKDPDIKKIVDSLTRGNKSCATIMIISPYRAQVQLLRRKVDLMQRDLMKQKLPSNNVKVDTVDAFQGQEADVVIFSLVRTIRAGFTDHPQRINVALTRAKRVVRIVGDLEFWSSQESPDSILKKLVEHCKKLGAVGADPRIRANRKRRIDAWLKPNWGLVANCIFKTNMSASFHHAVKGLKDSEKNIAFNTLIKVALPSEKDLWLLPRQDRDKPWWQMSALKGCEEKLQIIWCAREGGLSVRPIIEAHFAGSKEDCLHFQQTHPVLPKGSACIKRDLNGLKYQAESVDHNLGQSQNIELSWTLTKSIGDAMLDRAIDDLPEGCFDLDPSQAEILHKPLPRMIESGSGTGKTNVLLQHAVAYAHEVRDIGDEDKCICFVTVSPRLRVELAGRYGSIEKLEKIALPTIKFYSFKELLGDLLSYTKLEMNVSESCTFIEYVHFQERKSHTSIGLDTKEVENEIGGVIMGSLDTAISGRALTREEYIVSVRSYIEKDTDAGKQKRHEIYDWCEKYVRWKLSEGKFDINDIVIKLINKLKDAQPIENRGDKKKGGWFQIFNAAYLDEIQDFSYASIYLICNIAGTQSLRWIFAGDTAQMISPGCSFKFDGLKEVLLAVQPGIESKLKHVDKLGKNYRVTKDVLNVSNSILNVAKQHFRNDIQYLRPEIPMKDLGTRVRVCGWQEALNLEKPPRFGPNQALIYSSTGDSNEVASKMNKWLNSHPFILTSLDSKGLEFDDCVIAFDVERKAWNINTAKVSSLMLLRELYVAVTRAKRRVVILAKTKDVRDFFMSLKGCNIEESDAKAALLEFDSATKSEEWLKRGKELFENEQYKVAANCFKAAENFAHFEWAEGLYEMEISQKETGKECFRRSAHFFFEKADYNHTLELLSLVMNHPPWNSDDDFIYDASREKLPSYFPREKIIQFALLRNKWNEISIDDFKDSSSAPFFLPFRKNDELINMISTCSQHDLSDIEYALPLLIADYYFGRGYHFNAIKLYLQDSDHSQHDFDMAEEATNLLIGSSNSMDEKIKLDSIAKCWRQSRGKRASETVSKDRDASLLLRLYEDPVIVAESRSNEALRKFGQDVIRFAFECSKTPKEELHRFHHTQFENEVEQALSIKFRNNLIEALQWYLHRNDNKHAKQLAANNIEKWSKEDLLAIARCKLNPEGLAEAVDRKDGLIDLVKVYLSKEIFDLDQAVYASDRALSSVQKAEDNYNDLIGVWEKHENDRRVKTRLERKQPKPPGPKTIVLLNLFWKPEHSSMRLAKYCMEYFGSKIVEIAVKSAINDPKKRLDILLRFDKQAFEHLRPAPNFNKGDRIILHGLKNVTYNGKRGKITQVQAKERYGVKLDGAKKQISFHQSNIKIYDSDSDDSDTDNNAPDMKSMDKSIVDSRVKQKQKQSKTTNQYSDSESSDDEPPPLNDRDESSSENSSSDGSIPELLERGNQSHSSDSSEGDDSDRSLSKAGNDDDSINSSSSDDDSSSSSGNVPALTRKDNSSSDEEGIPALIGPNQQSSSSSDESVPRQRSQRGRGQRGTKTGRGRGGERGRGKRRGNRK